MLDDRPAGGGYDPFDEDDDDQLDDVDAQGRAQARPKAKPGAGPSILMAAMLGLADGLGFERPKTEIVMAVADASAGDGDKLDLEFGSLEPLD